MLSTSFPVLVRVYPACRVYARTRARLKQPSLRILHALVPELRGRVYCGKCKSWNGFNIYSNKKYLENILDIPSLLSCQLKYPQPER